MKKLLSLGLILLMLLSIIPLGAVTVMADDGKIESLKWIDGKYYYLVNGEKTNDTLIYNTYYIKDGVWQDDANGVVEVNGVWYYLQYGMKNNITNRIQQGDKYLYVQNGIWDPTFTSLARQMGYSRWHYYENGVWNPDANDLIKYKGKWFYIEDGMWKSSVNTLFKKNGKWFYIENGKWNKNTNKLISYNGKTFYIENGKWAKKTLIFNHNTYKYYIKNGKFDNTANGVIKVDGELYYIKKGKVGGHYIIKHNGEYLFFNSGKYDKKANGVYHAEIPKALGGPDYEKVLVKNGKLSRENTLGKYGYIWYYFEKGISKYKKCQKIVPYKDKWFYIEDNQWRKGFTSLVKIDNEWYYIKNGKWDDEDAIASYKGKYFYVKSGKVDLSFCGKVNIYGVTLNVKYGKLKP